MDSQTAMTAAGSAAVGEEATKTSSVTSNATSSDFSDNASNTSSTATTSSSILEQETIVTAGPRHVERHPHDGAQLDAKLEVVHDDAHDGSSSSTINDDDAIVVVNPADGLMRQKADKQEVMPPSVGLASGRRNHSAPLLDSAAGHVTSGHDTIATSSSATSAMTTTTSNGSTTAQRSSSHGSASYFHQGDDVGRDDAYADGSRSSGQPTDEAPSGMRGLPALPPPSIDIISSSSGGGAAARGSLEKNKSHGGMKTGSAEGGGKEPVNPYYHSGTNDDDGDDEDEGRRKRKNVKKKLRSIGRVVFLKKFFKVASIYFFGDKKWAARGLFLVMFLFCCINTALFYELSYVERDMATALSDKQVSDFWHCIYRYVFIIVLAVPFLACLDFLQGYITLEWRIWLTNHMLARYFAGRVFFHMKQASDLDNPDQRITQDVASFVRTSVSIVVVIAGKVLNLIAFSAILWEISMNLVYFLIIYTTLGTFLALVIFGHKLMELQYQGLEREANFRYSLIRVRDNVESIAFYRGEQQEESAARGVFQVVVDNVRLQLVWGFFLHIFFNAYQYASILVPTIIIAPDYFDGKVEFGVITQTTYAFSKVIAALSFIIFNINTLSSLAAETERLETLLSALITFADPSDDQQQLTISDNSPPSPPEKSPKGGSPGPMLGPNSGGSPPVPSLKIKRQVGPSLALSRVTVCTPNLAQVFFRETLSFKLDPGHSLLVMGPSGCGKSSLMRAIAGLWGYGEGTIASPPTGSTFFLPQRPYMPIGSLRMQLCFPHKSSSDVFGDSKLYEVLSDVSLDAMAKKVGGLDAQMEWADVLSTGEQQRVAFARLLLHEPKLAFLDEATSALDIANEAKMYTLLKSKVEGYVSVGHRLSLLQYHTHVLHRDDQSSWHLMDAREFASQLEKKP